MNGALTYKDLDNLKAKAQAFDSFSQILIATAELVSSLGWQHGSHQQQHQAVQLRKLVEQLKAALKSLEAA